MLYRNTYTTGNITEGCAIQVTCGTIEYTVTAISSGEGSISPSSQTITAGNKGSVTVFTKNQMDHWINIIGCGISLRHVPNGAYPTATINGDCSIEATFEVHEIAPISR